MQEEALVLELERKKREEDSRQREIQRICEEDPSLRELASKLQVSLSRVSQCAAYDKAALRISAT